jgi:hypothetical protein
VDAETREALERLERGLRDEIQASAAATQARIEVRLTESEERTRRHFDVVSESLRGEIRLLAESITVVAEGSMRRDDELGARIGGVEHRVLGLESRVSTLEQPPPRRRRPR